MTDAAGQSLPYKIAVLVYLFNGRNDLLLLHRLRPPNRNLYSPIGGKLEQSTGESPYACALREVEEEVGLRLSLTDMRLLGMVSEKAFEGQTHWLMFCFEITTPVDFPSRQIEEGRLEWVALDRVEQLDIPETDRKVIWPLVRRHSKMINAAGLAEKEPFSVHIDCSDPADMRVTHEHPRR